jgi:hypothetical protein
MVCFWRHLLTARFVVCALVMLGGVSLLALATRTQATTPSASAPIGTAFTYQGLLEQNGSALTGVVDLRFTLYDAADQGQGSLLGTVEKLGVQVQDGIFSVDLDFGDSVFDGSARWLAIAVRHPAGPSGVYEPFADRQPIYAVPYAIHAATAGSVPWSGITGRPTPASYSAGSGLSLTAGEFSIQFGGTGSAITASRSDHTHSFPAPTHTHSGSDITSSVAVAESVPWSGLTAVPTAFPPASHTHAGSDVTGKVGSASSADSMPWAGLTAVPTAFPPTSHTHTGDQVTSKVESAQVAESMPWTGLTAVPTAFPPASHTHAGTEITGKVGAAESADSATVATAVPWSGITGKPDVQDRVSGACASGFAVQSVKSDGSVVCGPTYSGSRAAAPAANTIVTPDNSGDVGQYTSTTIGTDGFPIVAYYDATAGDLKIAHCRDIACTTSSTSTIDSADNVGKWASIAIGSDGLPVVSYYDATGGNLKVAHCSDVACTSAAAVVLDGVDGADVGMYTSIAIGADGFPIVAYYDVTNTALKVTHCEDTLCATTPTIRTLVSAGTIGQYASIAIGWDGRPFVVYTDGSSDVQSIHCKDATCSPTNTSVVVDNSGDYAWSTVVIGPDGRPIVAYFDTQSSDLKVAACADATCAGFTSMVLDTVSSLVSVGEYPSITIGSDGFPIISYYDSSNGRLRVAHCDEAKCQTAVIAVADGGPNVGRYTAITIGVDGLPAISYYDVTNSALKLVHCASVACTPYVRRR